MNDDELVQRLRRTLHEQAEGIQPTPGRLPTGDAVPPTTLNGAAAARRGSGAGSGDGSSPTALGPPPDAERRGPSSGERQTAEYALTPPTGPVPIFGRRTDGGRRWPPVVGVGAIAALAAAVALAVVLSGGKRPVTVRPAAPTPAPATTLAPTRPTTRPAPATIAPAPPTPTTLPAAASRPVPIGFQPLSVTFVSPDDGWAVGWSPATNGRCATVVRTTDAGQTWTAIGAPRLSGSCPGSDSGTAPFVAMRFADREDGWIYTPAGSGQLPTQLWATHDGGSTWTADHLPMAGATIGEIEASGAQVQMVLYGPCPAGTAGCQGQTVEQIFTSGVGADRWTASFTQPQVGAGPVLSTQMTLWGNAGWIVNTNRTVVSGAQLAGGTRWSDWNPPCTGANGAGLLAAASPTDLVAVCAEGVWGTPDRGTTAPHNWLFRSTDGGSTFSPVGPLPGDQPQSITAAPGTGLTIVVADAQEGLLGSFNGGASWTVLEPGLASSTAGAAGNLFGYVGFTTPTQGVAISYQPTPTLFMTRDGGHTWNPVSF